MIKDKFGKNIRRNDRVRDARPDMKQEGTITGTFTGSAVGGRQPAPSAAVEWDDGEEETIRGVDLILSTNRFAR